MNRAYSVSAGSDICLLLRYVEWILCAVDVVTSLKQEDWLHYAPTLDHTELPRSGLFDLIQITSLTGKCPFKFDDIESIMEKTGFDCSQFFCSV